MVLCNVIAVLRWAQSVRIGHRDPETQSKKRMDQEPKNEKENQCSCSCLLGFLPNWSPFSVSLCLCGRSGTRKGMEFTLMTVREGVMSFCGVVCSGSKHPRRLKYPALRYHAKCVCHNMLASRYLWLRACYSFFAGRSWTPLTKVSTNVYKCLLFWGGNG